MKLRNSKRPLSPLWQAKRLKFWISLCYLNTGLSRKTRSVFPTKSTTTTASVWYPIFLIMPGPMNTIYWVNSLLILSHSELWSGLFVPRSIHVYCCISEYHLWGSILLCFDRTLFGYYSLRYKCSWSSMTLFNCSKYCSCLMSHLPL